MRIIAEQRYIKKPDGKMWLQWRCYENVSISNLGRVNLMNTNLSDWQDVPVCLDEWEDKDSLTVES